MFGGGEPGGFPRRWVRVSLLGFTCPACCLFLLFPFLSFMCGRILAFCAVEFLFSCAVEHYTIIWPTGDEWSDTYVYL